MSAEKSRTDRSFDVKAWRQFQLVRLALCNKATAKADVAILAEIIQRYHGKYGNSWASHEMLGLKTGTHKTTVIKAIRRLAGLGFVSIIEPGRRGRSTVYLPNFELIPEYGSVPTTETGVEEAESFGSVDATKSTHLGSADATETALLGSADATPSYLLSPAYKAGGHVDRNSDAAPLAPPAPIACASGTAGPAPGGVEEFWSIWPRKHGLAKVRTAYAKAVASDPAIHDDIVKAAHAWAVHYAKHGTDMKWVPEPTNWLTGERWKEDLPIIHGDSKGAAIAKAKANGPARSRASASEPAGLFPPGEHRVRIAAAEEVGSPFGSHWAIDLTLVGVEEPIEGVEFKTRLEILDDDGEGTIHGAGNEAYFELHSLTGSHSPTAFLPGHFVGAHNLKDGGVSFTSDPAGMRLVEIDRAEIVKDGGERWIRLELTEPCADGSLEPTGRIDIIYESHRASMQNDGQESLRKLLGAVGLREISDTEELLSSRFTLRADGSFLPAPANDDAAERRAA